MGGFNTCILTNQLILKIPSQKSNLLNKFQKIILFFFPKKKYWKKIEFPTF